MDMPALDHLHLPSLPLAAWGESNKAEEDRGRILFLTVGISPASFFHLGARRKGRRISQSIGPLTRMNAYKTASLLEVAIRCFLGLCPEGWA